MSNSIVKVQNDFKRNACPLCGSDSVKLIGNIEYRSPIVFSNREVSLDTPSQLFKCQKCESGYTENIINEVDVISLYSYSDSSKRWSSKSLVESKAFEIIDMLSSLIFEGANVVDVGCNTGELLDFAKSLGADTFGIELSENSRKILQSKGHKSIKNLDDIENLSMDVITAFDLLEHLHDPNEFLRIACKKLVSGGKLILLTGNINSISAKLSGAKWWYCRYPEHITFVSKKYLSSLSGFSLDYAIETYASMGYKKSRMNSLIAFVVRYPLRFYSGLPSIGHDHFLFVLTKNKKKDG